ncbi:hypothetical protein Acr_00g0086910 [Actinidia rufa]|uniref:Uncharacterized protein n=1 Tax=Actinidia rufa TaxID=165716 RepID=A0A7J0DX40_9ERIC|nr:hypothetical protein Acr_00g0086910 [Actinidia rufa]
MARTNAERDELISQHAAAALEQQGKSIEELQGIVYDVNKKLDMLEERQSSGMIGLNLLAAFSRGANL